ncbi:MAG TPA: hypothetical protein DCS93_39060 [Microscillaceae bacterium]|nr:hypothetical protein [Microscillaceae bacterium]
MLKYTKFILKKMSFDRVLFEKELRKAIGLLSAIEVLELRVWCEAQFGEDFQGIIALTFADQHYQCETELTE